jgi:hypothetical protein
MHSSTLAKLRLQALQQQEMADAGAESLPWSFSALELYTSQLQECSNAFSAQHMPPLAEYSSLLALQELQTKQSPSRQNNATENSRCKSQVHDVALAGSGAAFKELQESTCKLIQEDLVRVHTPGGRIHDSELRDRHVPRFSRSSAAENRTEATPVPNDPQPKAGHNQTKC